jgi:hypothetical protein
MEENIAKLRQELALALAAGRVIAILRKLRQMPLEILEALSNVEAQGIVDRTGLDDEQIQGLEAGFKKLDFYVCGILMHRVLDEK